MLRNFRDKDTEGIFDRARKTKLAREVQRAALRKEMEKLLLGLV
jgi:hypothetical protein